MKAIGVCCAGWKALVHHFLLLINPMIDTSVPFERMTVTCTEEDNGGLCVTFDWDDTDPAFEPLNQMTEQERRSFILASISNRLQEDLDAAS